MLRSLHLVLLALLIWTPTRATALAVVDQDFLATSGLVGIIILPGEATAFGLAQTFTVGATGDLIGLSLQISVFLNSPPPTGPLTVEIQSVALDGTPSGSVLASESIDATDLPFSASSASLLPIAIDFSSSPIAAMSGDLLAIVLTAETSYEWTVNLSFGHTSGQFYWNGTGEWEVALGGVGNFGFRTLMEVPEPGLLILLLSALGATWCGLVAGR